MEWYPQDKKELSKVIDKFLEQKLELKQKQINGLIVPHAGYSFSGEIVGKAYALLKEQKPKIAIILAPSHYLPLSGIASHNQPNWQTSLGNIDIIDNNFHKIDISKEHAIDNQVPFLQKLGFKKILPLVIGEITREQAKEIASEISKIEAIIIVSTDLSHFLPYNEAVKKDKETIKAIENLDSEKLSKIENSACGIYPLKIIVELCKIKNWMPKLIEYKNSGDITGDKSSVVGYASFCF